MTATALHTRLAAAAVARLASARGSAVLSRTAMRAAWRARAGAHPVDAAHAPHLAAALDWLCRAQDEAGGRGIARGYSLVWNPYFRAAGWQPAYPETTGYIIPTLLSAADREGRPELADRALRAAEWEVEVQLPSGAVQGGVIGQPPSPAVFNTGQVLLGWVAALRRTGDARFAEAIRRAGSWLASVEENGAFVRGNSKFARPDATAYNARAAWGLAEAGSVLNDAAMSAAAHRVLRAVALAQAPDGWFPGCCLYDPERPLLHTLAYAARGLLEGGRVLGDESLIRAADRAARGLMGALEQDGRLPGRFARGWLPAAPWSCVTGQVQTASVWLRLDEILGERSRAEAAGHSIAYVKGTQDRTAPVGGVRGGIPGSWPLSGDYGSYEMLSWAAKFFADALMRHQDAIAPDPARPRVLPLA